MLAKNVYNEYITDRHHVHMNATRWLTLTEFVKYLGKSGEAVRERGREGGAGWTELYALVRAPLGRWRKLHGSVGH